MSTEVGPEKPEDELLDSPAFKFGMELGVAIGHSNAVFEAQRAQQAGELELWLEWATPKTLEGWDEWHDKHGRGFADRWKKSPTDNKENDSV